LTSSSPPIQSDRKAHIKPLLKLEVDQMNDNTSVEEKIDAIFNWFRGARPGEAFTPRNIVEWETGVENSAFARLVPDLPQIKKMIESGWVEMDGRYAILTVAGKVEMERRGQAMAETTRMEVAVTNGITLPPGHEVHVFRTGEPTKTYKILSHLEFEDADGNIHNQQVVFGRTYARVEVVDLATGTTTRY
jgi:hypothetical protein